MCRIQPSPRYRSVTVVSRNLLLVGMPSLTTGCLRPSTLTLGGPHTTSDALPGILSSEARLNRSRYWVRSLVDIGMNGISGLSSRDGMLPTNLST